MRAKFILPGFVSLLAATLPAFAQTSDPFRSTAPTPPAPAPRPHVAPTPEPEPPFPVPRMPAVTAPPPLKYDGIYVGQVTREVNSTWCGTASWTDNLNIKNNQVSYVISFSTVVTGPVDENGNVIAYSQNHGAVLNGSIRSGDFTGIAVLGTCRLDLRFKRQP